MRVLSLCCLLASLAFGSIQYAGAPNINATLTQSAGTRAELVAWLSTELQAAGWAVASGSGTNIILQSANTANSNHIQVRLYDAGSGNCGQLFLRNVAGTLVSQTYYLLPAVGKTWRVVANKYQAFIFTPGTTVAREFVGFGTLYVPTFLATQLTGDLGWMQGNAPSDTGTTVYPSFRYCLLTGPSCPLGSSGNGAYWSGIAANVLGQSSFAGGGVGQMMLIVPSGAAMYGTGPYRWRDNSLILSEALIVWGPNGYNDEGKLHGQLYDAMVASDAFTIDQTLTAVDNHNWYALTNSGTGSSSSARGTIFLVVP